MYDQIYAKVDAHLQPGMNLRNNFGSITAIRRGTGTIWNTASSDWLGSQNLNMVTSEAQRGYEQKTSCWAFWEHKDGTLDGYPGFREHTGDCIKNILRDNVIGSWSKTDRLCQVIKNSVSPDWQSDWFSPLLPSKMEVFCCNLNLVSRIFTSTRAYNKYMHRLTHSQALNHT